jgi:hypothetical protein
MFYVTNPEIQESEFYINIVIIFHYQLIFLTESELIH